MRSTVVSGLKKYLKCPVIRANQNAEPPPFPYVTYTVITPMSENNGTYGEYADGVDRKPFTQTWSISALSDDDTESFTLACKAREWLDRVGTVYLNDNDVIVQIVGSITNRDNVLTIDYQYRKGFDVVFWMLDEIGRPETETIENVEFAEDHSKRLENRLDGVAQEEYWTSRSQEEDEEAELARLLADRMNGV